MTQAEETKCLRTLQEAPLEALQTYLEGGVTRQADGVATYAFQVTFGEDAGELDFDIRQADGEILRAHMDVNFPTALGLNRSPLELRILCEHVRDLWPTDLPS